MLLIGMLDSHYVRRVAISLQLQGLRFEHRPLAADAAQMTQAGVTTAISWHFAQQMLPLLVPAAQFPVLAAFSAEAESLAPFRAAAHGDGHCVPP